MHENIKQAGLFLIKAVAFSLIFWGMWVYVVRPITNAQTTNSSCNNQVQAESTDQDTAMKKYMEQAAKAEEQQQRMDSILTRQEQQSKRLDAILSVWEKQAKIAK
jgi:hypothetical protein